MNSTLAASLITAIGVSICWLWVLRRLIAIANEKLERKEAIIREMHKWTK